MSTSPKVSTAVVYDFTARNEGSIILISPHSEAAKEWWSENVSADAQRFGDAYAVEHRYAGDIIQGMLDAGLSAPQSLTA